MNIAYSNSQSRIHLTSFQSKNCRGFTLTELLVVIAIIGILAAILIPVVGKVRSSANSTKCAANLRSMQLANQIYSFDNNGYYLSGTSFDEGAGVQNAWVVNKRYFEALTSLHAERGWGEWNNDLLCPTTHAVGSPNWNVIGSNYGISYWMFHQNLGLPGWGAKNTNWGIPVNQIVNPSNTVAFADCTDWILKTLDGYTFEDEEVNTGKGPLAFRHDGIAHTVNFDASITSYTAEDVKDPDVIKRFTLER